MTTSRLCGSRVLAAGPAGEPVELPGRQLAVLYARLALADGRPVGRTDLAAAVWGDDAPPSAQRTLSALLSRLRALLGPDAVSHGDAVVLSLAGDVDVDVLQLLAEENEAELALGKGELERAISHARAARAAVAGPLLPGHASPWAYEQRERVEDAITRASEVEAGALVAMGDPRAVPLARDVVARDPFRESAVVLLVDALLVAGDAAGALRAYEALRVRLRDDLGTVPGPRARAAHRRALEAELGASAPAVDIVGRDAELARIDAWRDAPGGLSVLAVQGERGVGLTTLARAAAARAAAAGWLVARGTCPSLPLEDHAGIAELLRDLVAQLEDADRRRLSPAPPGLTALVPALGPERSDAGVPLVSAIAALVSSAAHGQPVLLVLEDLHSAEAATLQLLHEVLAAARSHGVRVLTTYEQRHTEVATVLGALRRTVAVEDLELGRLSRQDVLALAGRHGPVHGLAGDVLEDLWQATCGHVLFVVELLRDLAGQPAGGRGPVVRVAPAVRQLVLDAAAELPPSARQVLALVAAAGRPVSGGLVAAAFRRDAEEVSEDLATARNAGLLARRADGAAAFAVPIVGRTIREDLDPLALRGLNLRLARAVAEDPVARAGRRVDVALHLLAAEELTDREEVGRAVVAAAREAIDEDRDPARAIDLCERALRLVEDEAMALRLRVLLAEARYRAGDATEARRLRLRVAADAQRLGDREAQLLAALDHDRPLEIAEHHPEDQAMLEGLLGVLPPRGPARVAATARLAVVAHHGPRWREHLELADEALRLAREDGDPYALARALAAKRFDAQRPGTSAAERRALTTELGSAVDRSAWPSGHAFVASWQVRDRWEAGDGLGFRAALRRLGDLVEQLQEPFWLLPLRCLEASVALVEGRFDASEAILRSIGPDVSGARGDTTVALGAALFMLRRSQGRCAELLPTIEGMREDGGMPWPGSHATALVAAGRVDEARRVIDAAAADDWALVPEDALWPVSAGGMAEAIVRAGAAEHAAHWYARLAPLSGTALIGPVAISLPADLLLGQLARLDGDDEAARRHLLTALDLVRGLQAPVYEAEVQDELAALKGTAKRR